jgi:CHASE2 domain-containing sensor protein
VSTFLTRFRQVAWIPLSALALAWGLSATPLLHRLEELALDAQLRMAAREHHFTEALVIDIDDASLDAMKPYFGNWPYSRDTYALLVDYLSEMGARAVAFDLVLFDPRPGDDAFRESIHRNANVVLATAARLDAPVQAAHSNDAMQGLTWSAPSELRLESWPSVQPPQPLFTQPAPHYAHLGVVSAIPEQDGLLRRIPLFHRFGEQVLPAISVAAHFPKEPRPSVNMTTPLSTQVGPLSIPVDKEGAMHLYFPRNHDAVVTLPFSRVAQAMLGAEGQALNATTFRGKTVFVGSTAFFTDRVLTPVGEMKGVNVLALIHQSLAQGLLLKASNAVACGLLMLIALLPALGLFIWPQRRMASATGLALAGGGLVYGCHFALLYGWHQESALLLPLLVVAFTLLLETIRALRQGAKQDRLAGISPSRS